MAFIALREIGVLLLGVAVAFAASLAGDAGRNFGALVVAILLPIAFCLVRAGLAKLPSENSSGLRHVAAQLSLGFALIALLVFEMGVAMFAGAQGIPAGVWVVLSVFGAGYVCLFVLAHTLSRRTGHHAI